METNNKPIIHYKSGEKLSRINGEFKVVDVTACAWANPPAYVIDINIDNVTCESCLKRKKANAWSGTTRETLYSEK